MQANATLLANLSVDCIVILSLNAQGFYRNRTLEVYAGDELLTTAEIPLDSFFEIEAPVHLVKGMNALTLRVLEGCERPSDKPELNNPDYRCLSVVVRNISIKIA